MTRLVPAAVLASLIAVGGAAPVVAIRDLPRGTTALDVFVNGGRLELLVAEEQATGFVLLHRVSTNAGRTWSAPVTIEISRGSLVNPGRNTDPQIVGSGQNLLAIWTSPGASRLSGGPLATAVSRDGGKTWGRGGTPNDDAQTGEHAFIDAVADAHGVFQVAWLDARDGRQGLRFSSSSDGGATWSRNQSIDTETCECCWTTLVRGWDDVLLALYRDIPRDMALARSEDGGRTWVRAGWVGEFHWEIQGCPDTGGGLTRGAKRGELHALVFTGEESSRGLYALWSPDNGRNWGPPVRVGAERAWHGDIERADNTLIAAWDVNGSDRFVGWSYSRDGGRSWTEGGRVSSPGMVATHPKVAAVNGEAVLFWTERDKSGVMSWKNVAVAPRPDLKVRPYK